MCVSCCMKPEHKAIELINSQYRAADRLVLDLFVTPQSSMTGADGGGGGVSHATSHSSMTGADSRHINSACDLQARFCVAGGLAEDASLLQD